MKLTSLNQFCHEKNKLKLSTPYFYDNIWVFDLNCKFNGFITMGDYLHFNTTAFFSVPLVPFATEGPIRAWVTLNSSKICKFFTGQNAFIKKLRTMLKKNKWVTTAIIQARIWSQKNKIIFSNLILTVIPYLWFSTNLKMFRMFSDFTGGISFFFNEISFFLNYLDEHFIDWDKLVIVSLQLLPPLKKLVKPTKYIWFFFFIPFVFDLVARIIWSSVGFCCYWGHSGWSHSFEITKLSTAYFNKSNYSLNKYLY